MSETLSPQEHSAGQLLGSFRHGKALPVALLILGIILFGLAVFVLYLGTILPPDTNPGPVDLTTSRGTSLTVSSPHMLIYLTSGFLAVLGVVMLLIRAWQKRLRSTTFDVYEHGITEIKGSQREYTPFREIEDLYLFASGQASFTGLITNLAYRRNANQAWHHAIESLGGFHKFVQLVRERHVEERLPAVMTALDAGHSVTFNYLSSGKVWSKRMGGNFLNVTTQPLTLSRMALEVEGQTIPMTSLRDIDLNAWTENVVIKDASGNTVLSTTGTGIFSHDVFLHTLSLLLDAQRQNAMPAQESPQPGSAVPQ